MRLNSIQQSPSFGQLYILTDADGSNNYMMNTSDKQLDAIAQAGEDLKDTEYCHLVVDENGGRVVETPFANKYVGGTFFIGSQEPDNEFLPFIAKWAGNNSGKLEKGGDYNGSIKFINANAAREAYRDIKQTPLDSIERDVKITKYLNSEIISKKTQAEQESIAIAARRQRAQELMNNYRRPELEE